MHDSSCLFCRIASGDHPVQRLFHAGGYTAFPDARPQAQKHILVIPDTHVATLEDLQDPGGFFAAVTRAARDARLVSYRVRINVRPPAQHIPHLHAHVLSPR